MKSSRMFRSTGDSENINTGGFLLLLSAAVIFTFTASLWLSDFFSQDRTDHGAVQETLGDRIQVLVRFDQERQAQLLEQKDNTVQAFTAFVNGREGRLQETLGQSIAGKTQTIIMEQKRLRGALVRAKEDLRLFKEGRDARWQEKMGMAVVRAYRSAPDGGSAFQAALQREINRMNVLEERVSRGLASNLKARTAEEAVFQTAIPGMYRDAIESARRSAQLHEASYMASAGRILHGLNADLSWQRQPEDYVQMAGGVREILGDFRGVGGFVEYGWAALIGLFAAMAWLGASIPKDPFRTGAH
jgi:hypothetical protein